MAERKFIYVGNSMLGVFAPGDAITAASVDAREVERGDIVVFKTDAKLHPYVHRVIDADGHKIVTQGDNNLLPDRLPIAAGSILYKVKSAERHGAALEVRHGESGWRQFRKNQRKLRFKRGAMATLRPLVRLAPLRIFAPLLGELKQGEFKAPGGGAKRYLYLGKRPVARFCAREGRWIVLGGWKLFYSPAALNRRY